MKFNLFSATLYIIAIISVFLYAVFGTDNSILFFSIFSLNSFFFILDVMVVSYKEKCLIGFYAIANIFAGLIFFIRPLQLLSAENLNSFSVFQRYSIYYNNVTVATLPWAKAALIGLLGIMFINVLFLLSHKRKKLFVDDAIFDFESVKFTSNQKLGISLFYFLAFISACLYGLKLIQFERLRIYDLLWVFLFSSLIIYTIVRKKQANFLIYLVIAFSILLLSVRGRRQYAVNILLCYICSLYFAGKDSTKNFIRICLMIVIILIVVFVFGNVRRELIGATLQDSLFEGLLGEFSMFDMLLVSLKYVENTGLDLFWGYNYLSLFTTPIPGITIQPFDHRLTDIIFKGNFHGGIPTSLFGSLYFNFSFVGVCCGSLLMSLMLFLIQKHLSNINNLNSIGYYSIFTTFVYDIIRVGDIGRETWSLITFLLVFHVFSVVMSKFESGRKLRRA